MQDLNYHSACNNYPNGILNMRSRRYVGLTNLFFFLLSAGPGRRELSIVAAVFVYLVNQQTLGLHLLNIDEDTPETRSLY